LLFIIEGAPTVLFVPVAFSFLPDSPGQAKFLSEGEQTEAVERMQTKDQTPKNKVHWDQLFVGILDYRNVVRTLIHFMCKLLLSRPVELPADHPQGHGLQ
jgi:hypothetical protein